MQIEAESMFVKNKLNQNNVASVAVTHNFRRWVWDFRKGKGELTVLE